MGNGVIRIRVAGKPEPAGSKRAFPVKRRDGSTGVAVSESNPRARGWKERIIDAVKQQYSGPMLLGPISLYIVFRVWRPKGHFKKNGELSKSAREFPTVRPDVTKLIRCAEDAMTGILWKDDAQIVFQTAHKLYLPRQDDIPETQIIVKEYLATASPQ